MKKYKVLIVDDIKDNVEILEQFFRSQGHETILAYGGKEAILKAETESPDIILLDVMMPDVDGFEVCRILKKERTHFKNIPVILVTARDDLESKVKGFSLGADDYLTKPYEIRELKARVEAALRLKEAHDKLKEVNNLKSHFLGMASHDIKSPISRIEKAIQILLSKKDTFSEDQVALLSNVKKQAQGIFGLITDLLNVTKIEAGKMGLECEQVEVGHLLDEVTKMNQVSADAKQIKLNLEVDKNIPKIIADPNRLLEVFENLLTNAIKFTPKGKDISIHIRSDKAGVEVVVSDQGVGIPNKELSRVFDRFSKISPQGTNNEQGTGLGLSICRDIVDMHHGKITVESKLNQGSVFKVFLPHKP